MNKIINNITIDNSIKVFIYPFKHILHVFFTDVIGQSYFLKRVLITAMVFNGFVMASPVHYYIFWAVKSSNLVGLMAVLYNYCFTIVRLFG